MAIKPVEWPAFAQWRQVLVRTWKEAGDDNVGLLAAGVAFYGFLAFVPLLASVLLTYGLVADPQSVAEHIQTLAKTLPREAAAIIADQLQAITGSKSGAHGLGLLLAIAIALYGASKGAGAIVTALNVAYEVKESRSFIRRTLLALLMTAGMAVVVLAAAAAVSALALIERLLPFHSPAVHIALKLLFWAVAALAVSGGVALLYRYGPNRPDAPWRWITPGSAAATLLWLVASLGFGLYVSNFGNYNATYGSLGGVVVFLTWLYLTSYILLMGGELNSELERQQAMKAQAEADAAAPAPVAATAAAAPEPHPSAAEPVKAIPQPVHPTRSGLPKAAALAAGGAVLLGLARRIGRRRAPGETYYRPPGSGTA
jgi:membrane protein